MAQKPSIPKGTRDFNSTIVYRREYIINKIKDQFKKFGFNPIETPSFENSSTLMGKYGEEGDRLIFKILNSGDFLSKISDQELEDKNSKSLISKISEKALRYDLTVPFARYVVQNFNDIDLPFKRYQIQNVWRADRPQKGRFREFSQCDADVVGSNSLFQEVDFVKLYDTVFNSLGLKGVSIKINNRKILAGIAEVIGAKDKLIDFTVALDKLDKIGKDKVIEEMISKGISIDSLKKLDPLFSLSGKADSQFETLKSLLSSSEEGLKGIEELEFIFNSISALGLKVSSLELDITLARGLNYYTGAIFEVSAPNDVKIGSIGGGGRYDDLTGIFGLKNMSGVGISFGLDRIYLVLEELNLFPQTSSDSLDLLFINFGDQEALESIKLMNQLRAKGLKVDLYPDSSKLKKQMNYANKLNVKFVAMLGEQELQKNEIIIKNMKEGVQMKYSFDDLISKFSI